MLYEHQSTLNPNMPFRDLIYVTRILQGRIAEKTIYSSAPIKLPAPRFVEQVRRFMKTLPINEAVEAAVAYCIEHDILRSFLLKNRAEVVDVCIFEYNEELHLKTVKEEGIEIGENRLAELLRCLNTAGRQEDINRALSDPDYRQELYLELHIGIHDTTE